MGYTIDRFDWQLNRPFVIPHYSKQLFIDYILLFVLGCGGGVFKTRNSLHSTRTVKINYVYVNPYHERYVDSFLMLHTHILKMD